ncbi:histidine kinase [Aliiglaciecola sp. CAU 1673]|uniref:histidine kinase n=1 Tax=Aliiglaciecola sp. CAU 1673 TaxID=3032595 RepID=UPI0023DC60A9|nr:sensor histidine kinase [Aliiglaciecola sp. CAU 1673]MDF2177365.1 histidine kinase [Aliiglaciecola sp. CAU 1673]
MPTIIIGCIKRLCLAALNTWRPLAALLLLLWGQSAHADIQVERYGPFRYYETLDQGPSFTSSSREAFNAHMRAQPSQGLFALEWDVELSGNTPPAQDWELNVHMLAAQSVYFDGVLAGHNGRPGASPASEVPGMVWTSYLIPNHLLTPGHHRIRIEASAHHRSQGMKLLRHWELRPFDPSTRYVSLWSLIPSLMVSVCLVIGLYFLMLFFTEGYQADYGVFSLFLLALSAYGFAIQWDHLVGYSYDWESLNLTVERISILLIVVLLPLYFMLRHKVPRIWLWLLGAALLTKLLQWILPAYQSQMLWIISFSLALFISLFYGFKSGRHYWWESLGLLLCLIGVFSQSLEDVFLYYPFLLSFVLLTHAISMQQRKHALRDAQLLEAQLRTDLLKKHIQPHFLLNTLTSLMEWTETDAEKSSAFIAELADEFRLMSKVASSQLSDLDTEIALCQKHLNLMSLRLQKRCELQVRGIEGSEPFPPAIFHTLVENAFSHNVYEQERIVFELEKRQIDADTTLFSFKAPLGRRQSDKFRQIGVGTGEKYIVARLNQCFGTFWSLKANASAGHWQTDIIVNYRKLKIRKEKEA